MLSIGKKLGPKLTGFALRQRPKRFRVTTSHRDTIQFTGSVC